MFRPTQKPKRILENEHEYLIPSSHPLSILSLRQKKKHFTLDMLLPEGSNNITDDSFMPPNPETASPINAIFIETLIN